MDPLAGLSARATPQSRRAAGAEHRGRGRNAAGGFAFALDDDVAPPPLPHPRRRRRHLLRRPARARPRDNARGGRCAAAPPDAPTRLVERGRRGLHRGRARRGRTRRCSRSPSRRRSPTTPAAAPRWPRCRTVARTGTHLFLFAALRRAVPRLGPWPAPRRRRAGTLDRDADDARLPGGEVPPARGLVAPRPAAAGAPGDRPTPRAADAVRLDRPAATSATDVPALIEAFVRGPGGDRRRRLGPARRASTRFPGRCCPTPRSARPAVWDALLDTGVPQTALMRQLPRLTRLGVLDRVAAPPRPSRRSSPTPSGCAGRASTRSTCWSRSARTPPGRSARGAGELDAVRQVVDALDAAFYTAFGAVEPAGKRTLLALDVSGSMAVPVSGLPITCREASAALALVTLATEPAATASASPPAAVAGATGAEAAAISPRQRLDDALAAVDRPAVRWHRLRAADGVGDGEAARGSTRSSSTPTTRPGPAHPPAPGAGASTGSGTGIEARLIVVGMTATDVSASPTRPTPGCSTSPGSTRPCPR